MTATKARRQPATLKLTEPAPLHKTDSTIARTVYGNTDECLHRWAANDRPRGSCGNVSFSNGELYSYSTVVGRHVAGRRTGERFVLLTTRRYSVTTSGHMSGAAHACRGQTVFHVDDVTAETVAQHRHNLTDYAARAAKSKATAAKARKYGAEHLSHAANLIREGNAYAAAVGLTERLTDDLDALEAEATTRRERDEKDKTDADRKREKQRAATLARQVAEWEQRLAAWKDGGPRPGYCPDHKHPLAGYAWLRLRAKNTVLETSMGVAVPVAAALPLLPLVRSGKHYLRYPAGKSPLPGEPEPMPAFTIDGFTPDQIRPVEREVQIGCHRISFDECFKIADQLGL